MTTTPCYYYLPTQSHSATFKDASKGKLVMVYHEQGHPEPLALIITQTGEFDITYATLVKVIGDDTERMKAYLLVETLKLAREMAGENREFETQLKLLFKSYGTEY